MSIIDKNKLEISDAEMLSSLASTALDTMQFLSKLNTKQSAKELNSILTPLSNGIAGLKTNASPELIENVKDNLDRLDELRKSKPYTKGNKKNYKETLDTAAIIYRDTLNTIESRNILYEQNQEVTDSLYNKLDAIAGQDSFSSDALDILEDKHKMDVSMINQSYDTQLAKDKAKLSNQLKEQDLITMASKIDAEDTIPGIQVELDKYNAGLALEFLESSGFATLKD